MRANVLAVGLVAGILALVANGAVATAIPVQTGPETESFTLATTLTNNKQVTFSVIDQATNSNSPQIDSLPLTFNKFDAGLGNLLAVTITFSSIYNATATLTVVLNGEGEDVDFFSDALVNHTLTGAGLIAQQSAPPQAFSATCLAFDFDSCDAPDASNNNVSFNTPAGGVGVGPLASFIGAGTTFDLTVELNSALTPRIVPDNGSSPFAESTEFNGTLDATWNGSVTVVYTYDDGRLPVPAPLGLYLLVAGLGVIALSLRRRP